jgi:hypothetical protein
MYGVESNKDATPLTVPARTHAEAVSARHTGRGRVDR